MDRKLKKKLKEQKGETLIEVILSVAIFSLVILMSATMYAGSMRGIQANYRAEKKIDELMSKIVKSEEALSSEVDRNLNFNFSNETTVSETIILKGAKLEDSKSMYKYAIRGNP